MKYALFALFAVAGFAAQAQTAPGTTTANTTKVTVNGMVCAFCAQGIEKRLEALPQTKAVYVNLGRKLVAVEAKPGQAIDEATLRNEIRDAGYDVAAVERSAQSLDEIRAQAKAAK